ADKRWVDHDLVFPSRHGTPIQPCRLLAHYKRLVGLAGVRDITIHGLRHTFATQALAGGVPLRVVSEALGHASPSVTMAIYAHVLREHRHIVADATGATLLSDD